MQLPDLFRKKSEWTVVGPLGPMLPNDLLAHPLMGVDGGAHWTPRLDLWVGDADSFDKEISCSHIFRHPQQKDRSDLGLALALFEEQILYKLHLWGFSGGRFDHEVFNLGEMHSFLNDHPESEIIIYRGDGKISMHFLGAGDWRFEHRGLFSLGSVATVRVKLTGACQYPIEKESRIAPLSSFGLSNEASGILDLQTDGPLFLYFPEGK